MIRSNSFGDEDECDANPWVNCYYANVSHPYRVFSLYYIFPPPIKYVMIVIYNASFDPERYISRYIVSF